MPLSLNLNLLFKHLRRVLNLSIPIVLSRAGAQVLTFLCVAFVGRVSTEELSYFSLALTPYLTLTLVGLCLISGIPVYTARLLATNDKQGINLLWRAGVWFVTFLSLAGVAVIFFCAVVTPHSSLYTHVMTVAGILAFGLPAILGYFFIASFLEALCLPKPAAMITIVAILAVSALNYLFLSHSNFGLNASSTVALVFVSVRWAMFLAALVAFMFQARKKNILLSLGSFKESLNSMVEQVKFGAPVAFAYGLRSLAISTLSIATTKLGFTEIAAFAVIANLVLLSNMVANGVSNAAIICVSAASADKNKNEVRYAVLGALTVAVILQSVISGTMLVAPQSLLKIFTSDVLVVQTIHKLLPVLLVLFGLDTLCTVMIGSLRPLNDRWVPQTVFATLMFLIAVPVGLASVGHLNWGIEGIATGMGLAYALSFLIISYRVWRNKTAGFCRPPF